MSSDIGIVSLSDWQYFKGLNAELDYSELDPRMVETVKLFNQIPNVTTRFCCSGHYSKELRHEDRFSAKIKPNIIFVMRSNTNSFVSAFQSWVDNLSTTQWGLLRPELKLCKLLYSNGEGFNHYWAWEIEMGWYPDGKQDAENLQSLFHSLVVHLHDKLKEG